MISLFRRPGLFWFSSNIKYRILSGLQLLTKIYELLTVLLHNLQRFSDNVSRNENQSNNSLEISPRFEWKLNVRINKVVKVQSPPYLSLEPRGDKVNQWSALVIKDGRASVGSLARPALLFPSVFYHIRRSPSSGLSSPVFMSKLRGDHLDDKISRPAAPELSWGWSDFSLLCWAQSWPVYLIY